MTAKIWNFWAKKYERLWVQKYSLRPTRDYITRIISKYIKKEKNTKILDLGCGPGELIRDLEHEYKNLDITGIDFSEGMLEVSRKRNPKVKHINMNVDDLDKLEDKFHIITCTHSLPYYKTPHNVITQLSRLLEDDGRIIIGFASGDSFYDKLALFFVKITTGSANYYSDRRFRNLIEPYFEIEDLNIIRERFFMPRIAIYTLKKVKI
ncbi:class I SAM-dependent methyltransferase [Tissierella sp.]|uniref:class I SAM-dependent methyltransferase n=1 Tax=Tissierella sp. TaxID=41274 RepID=UPI0028AABD9D|nr:class I SAM-dependent methyltransferase [Tissierella sp.]